MNKDTVVPQRQPEGQDLLSTMLREVAQWLMAEALQAECDEILSQFVERSLWVILINSNSTVSSPRLSLISGG